MDNVRDRVPLQVATLRTGGSSEIKQLIRIKRVQNECDRGTDNERNSKSGGTSIETGDIGKCTPEECNVNRIVMRPFSALQRSAMCLAHHQKTHFSVAGFEKVILER